MQDERGTYYYPNPMQKRTRMYVRKATDGTIEYRLWSPDDENIWENHGWITRAVVEQAEAMFLERGREVSPLALYDEGVAKALLR